MTDAPKAPQAPKVPLPGRFYHKHIRDAFRAKRPPDLSEGDPRDWIKTVDELLGAGRLNLARFTLNHLRKQAADLEWPKTMLEIVSMMPEGSVGGPRFVDDVKSDLQVVPREGARTVVMGFCGHRHQLNIPLWLFQRWMTKLPVSMVYLRDFGDTCYLGGVRSCGSFDATARRLRQVADEVKADRIVCLGNSSGGYGAMRYGLELGAARVFAFSGAVNMTPEFNTYLNRNEAALRLAETFPDARLDLRELYLTAPRAPDTELFYGDKSWDDRIHAEHMAGAPGVVLQPLAGYAGHGALPELIQRGRFDEVLTRFVASDSGG